MSTGRIMDKEAKKNPKHIYIYKYIYIYIYRYIYTMEYYLDIKRNTFESFLMR